MGLQFICAVEAEGGEEDAEDVLENRGAGEDGGGGGPAAVDHEDVLQNDDDGRGHDETDDAPVGLDLVLLQQHLDELRNGPDGERGADDERDDDNLIMISANGVIIRTPVNEVKLVARPAKGVKVMRILDDDRLITLSTTAKEEEQEEVEVSEGEAPVETTEGAAEVAEDSVETVEAEPVEE